MANYRTSRNIEASLKEYLERELAENDWGNITLEKSFNRVYDLDIGGKNKDAIICIRVEDTDISRGEIGSNLMVKDVMVLIDIFAANDGQRLDLKDFLISELILGCNYYEYATETSGRSTRFTDKTLNGRLRILNIDDTPINFETEKSQLDKHDRFRHRLSLTISRSKMEA